MSSTTIWIIIAVITIYFFSHKPEVIYTCPGGQAPEIEDVRSAE